MRLLVDGTAQELDDAHADQSLLRVLRDVLQIPSAKNACEQGECGSCSVLLDGVLVCSCCVLAADAVGSDVRTVEGMGDDGALTDVQQAFLEAGAVQCGFCIPGLIVAVHDLLDRRPDADELSVREAISGNLCRCGAYANIVPAIAEAARGSRSATSGRPTPRVRSRCWRARPRVRATWPAARTWST